MLAGLLSQIGQQEATEVRAGAPGKGADRDRRGRPRPRNEYLGARGARFAIFPGSALARKPPAWVMAAELVETSRLWARDVARIEPEWAEELAAHLVKRTYSEPAWSAKQGAAMATERVHARTACRSSRGRRVLFAKVDPEHARELFLRHALVRGRLDHAPPFFHTNRALLAQAAELEAARGAATWWSTTTPCSPSTTSASRPTSSPPALRHLVEARPPRAARTCSPSTPQMLLAGDADDARDPALFPDALAAGRPATCR